VTRVILQVDLEGPEGKIHRLQEEIQELVVEHGFNDGLVVGYPMDPAGPAYQSQEQKQKEKRADELLGQEWTEERWAELEDPDKPSE
jgi:hypothetical protein